MFLKKNKARKPRTITRRAAFTHGGEKVTMTVNLEAAATMEKLRAASEAMAHLEAQLKANPADETAQEEYGNAMLQLFACVLGRDGVEQLLDLYGKDLGSFVRDVRLFIFGDIVPAMRKAEARELRSGRTGAGWRWSNA